MLSFSKKLSLIWTSLSILTANRWGSFARMSSYLQLWSTCWQPYLKKNKTCQPQRALAFSAPFSTWWIAVSSTKLVRTWCHLRFTLTNSTQVFFNFLIVKRSKMRNRKNCKRNLGLWNWILSAVPFTLAISCCGWLPFFLKVRNSHRVACQVKSGVTTCTTLSDSARMKNSWPGFSNSTAKTFFKFFI